MNGSHWRTTRRALQWAIVAATVAVLFLVWPQSLGGKVAYVKVDGHSMDPTFHMGELALVQRQSTYRLGDPVAYRIPKGEFGAGALVIHRLVGGDGVHGYVTKGDNRNIVDEWHPKDSDVVGRVRYDIPRAGNLLGELTRPVYIGALVGGLTVLVMLWPDKESRRRRRTPGRHAATEPIEPARADDSAARPLELVP
jgi:signal peptidase